MMDQPRFHAALEQRHVQCVEHQLLINPFTHRRRRLVNERVRVVNNLDGIPPMTCPKGHKSVETVENSSAARNVTTVIH
jgi:hypothetical protein